MKCPECWQPLWDKCPAFQSDCFAWPHLEISKAEYAGVKIQAHYFKAAILLNSILDDYEKPTSFIFPFHLPLWRYIGGTVRRN